jgi:hypothetical protein
MNTELCKAYEDTCWMLEDGIRKISDAGWRTGPDDYLVPVRIAYHLLKSFEWLVNELPREEFLATRKYKLDWLGPVEPMPSREEMLAELTGLQRKVLAWLEKAVEPEKIERALYILRHTQHHIGELSIIARLIHCESPEWK